MDWIVREATSWISGMVLLSEYAGITHPLSVSSIHTESLTTLTSYVPAPPPYPIPAHPHHSASISTAHTENSVYASSLVSTIYPDPLLNPPTSPTRIIQTLSHASFTPHPNTRTEVSGRYIPSMLISHSCPTTEACMMIRKNKQRERDEIQ